MADTVTLPPDFEKRKRALLERKGLDPMQYDIDIDTMSIVKRATPAAGIPETLATTAAFNIPEAATSVLGGRLGGKLISGMLRTPNPWVKGAGVLAGSIAAPALLAEPLQELKNIWLPNTPLDPAKIERMRRDRPIASEIGSQLSAAPFFRPSNPFKLGALEAAAGAGVGAGIPIAQDIAAGRDIDLGRAAVGAGGNLLMSKPTALGRWVGGMPVPQRAQQQQAPEAPVVKPQFNPEITAALKEMGVDKSFADDAALESFLRPVREWLQQSPKKRAYTLKVIEGKYNALKKARDITPADQFGAIDEQMKELESQYQAITLANKISESSGMFSPKDTTQDEGVPFDTGEREHEETGFEGYKPPEPPLKQPTEDAYWETAGSEPPPAEPERLGKPITDVSQKTPVADMPGPVDKGPPKLGKPVEGLEPLDENPYEGMSEQTKKATADYAADAQTRHSGFGATSEAFKRWFGDSKVVDKEGKPLRQYHATAGGVSSLGGFDDPKSQHPSKGAFNTSIAEDELGSHFGTSEAALDRGETLNSFARNKPLENLRTIPVYLNIERPLLMPDIFPLGSGDLEGDSMAVDYVVPDDKARIIIKQWLNDRYNELPVTAAELRADLQKLGYDGIVYENRTEGKGSDSWIAFRPEQIKSALHNTGEYSKEDPAIYHSGLPNPFRRRPQSQFGLQDEPEIRSRSGLNFLASETDKLRAAGPEQARMADAMSEVFNKRREYQGRYANPIIRAFESLSPEQQQTLYSTLINEDRTGRRGNIPQEIQPVYDTIRQTIRQMATDQQRAGQMVRLNNGYRQRGIDPFYAPNVIGRTVRRVLAEGQGTQQFQQLQRDFIQWQIQHGISITEAERRFQNLLGSLRDVAGDNAFNFKAVRMPEGVGLPDSWIEPDPVVAFRKYVNSFTKDRAFYDVFETSPDLMAALGSRSFANGQQIPNTVRVLNLAKDPQVVRLGEAYAGADQQNVEPAIAGVGRLINAALLGGPVTKITDIATVPFNALKYTAPGHASDITKGIASWREGYANAFKQGFNREGGMVVAQDILGIGEHAADLMTQVAEGITKWTGSEKLELISRGLSQAIGEFVGDSHRAMARAGDANSIQFLNKLSRDWQSLSREELGTRVGQLLQGRYDITNLPAWAMQGRLAPFVTMMRWSIEQTNNFMRHVVEPARQGNWTPLAKSLIGGLGGGLLINELREQISGKKPYTANWKELKEGQKDPGFSDALAYKLISAAQVTGTAGVLMELMRQGYEEATGRMPQGFRYPVYEVAKDIWQRTSAAINGINEGEDPVAVTGQLTKDLLNRHVQIFRVIRNQLGKQGVNEEAAKDTTRSNMMRDQDVFTRMKGLPREASVTAPPSYSRITERKFDEETNPKKAVEMRSVLLNRAQKRTQDAPPEFRRGVLDSELRKLKTVNVEGMPSPDSQPEKFMAYYEWIRRTQGDEKARQLMQEYMRRRASAEFKRSLIPSLGGR